MTEDTPKPKKPRGAPKFIPAKGQRELVQAMISCGVPVSGIARYLRLSKTTVSKYFKADIKNGRETVQAAASGLLVQKALGGNMTALIFLLKTQFGFSERHTFVGKDGEPISFDRLDTQSLELLAKSLRKGAGASRNRSSAGAEEGT